MRVRATPVSAAPADPLALRHGSSSDIVPGCDWTDDVSLPAELHHFFVAVCEVPMDDWGRAQRFAAQNARHLAAEIAWNAGFTLPGDAKIAAR